MPQYKRFGDTFYKIDGEIITKIEPDTGMNYYQYVGLSGEDIQEVLSYDTIGEDDWNEVLNDVKECARVGSRPNIPPPPGE